MFGLSTVKIFIIVAVASLVLFLVLGGTNPFGFGNAYLKQNNIPVQEIDR